jgi:glycosyltransferase involved in cell wall biosynthesis
MNIGKLNRKVVFVHDGPFRFDINGDLIITNNIVSLKKRYEYLGGDLTFMLRGIHTKDTNTENKDVKVNFIQVPVFNRPHQFKNYFKARHIVESTIKNNDVAVIRLPSTIGALAVTFAKKFKKPYIIEVVGCPQDTLLNYNLMGKLYAPFAKLKLKSKVKNAPYLIYVSNSFLQKRYPSSGNQIAISNVIINETSDSIIQKIERYKSLNSKSRILISTLGAVDVPYKGQEYVIRAISNLKKTGYDVHYHIAGLGSVDRLRSIAKKEGVENQVHFEGLLNRESLFALLDKTDIYVQSSLTEGLPRSVVEAMSRGCICIGTDVGGIPELIQPELLFKKRSVNQITKLILRIINMDNREEIAVRNFEIAKSFNYDILEEKRKIFYNKFIEIEAL